jgi:hypothetical protein
MNIVLPNFVISIAGLYPRPIEKSLEHRMSLNSLKARIVKGNYRNINGVRISAMLN